MDVDQQTTEKELQEYENFKTLQNKLLDMGQDNLEFSKLIFEFID